MLSDSRTLLFSSAPKADESLVGYLLRLTELNRLNTLSWMLQMARIKSYVQTNLSFAFDPSVDFLPLSKLAGVDVAALSALMYAPEDPVRKPMGDYLVFGSPVPQYMIRVRHPKVCSACLREENYARRIWELSPVTACPIHMCLLLDECPNCSKRLTWARRKVSSCICGLDWRESDPPLVIDVELEVSRQIHLRCKLQHRKGSTKRDTKNNPLYNADLRNFLSGLFFIASQYAGRMDTKGKHLAPSMRSRELHALLCKAITVFENWPNNYFAFLDWRRTRVSEMQTAEGLDGDFAGYKSALYTQLVSSQLNFMPSAFEEYLSSRWDGGYTAHLRRLSEMARQNGKYASRREAKALLKVGVQGIDGLIAAGKLKGVVRHRNGSRLILIERECLHEFKCELEQSLYLRQVEKALGVSRKRIMELIDASLLSPLRGPSVDGCSDWKFSKREVEDLLARAIEKVRTAKSAAGHIVSFLMAFRKLTRASIGIAQFLRAILDGEVVPCGKAVMPGLAALLFSKAQISAYACKQRHEYMGEIYNAPEAAKLLGVTRDVVYFLARKGILSSRNSADERYPELLIGKDNLEEFNSTYILPAKIAKQLDTVSGYMIRLLTAQGIQPVSGPRVDGGKQYVFKKSDLDITAVKKIVSASSQRNGRVRP